MDCRRTRHRQRYFGLCFCMLLLLTYCSFWDPLEVPGHCINEVVTTTMFSLTLLVTDLKIYVMLMLMRWKLKVTTRMKIETSLVFLIGLLNVTFHLIFRN